MVLTFDQFQEKFFRGLEELERKHPEIIEKIGKLNTVYTPFWNSAIPHIVPTVIQFRSIAQYPEIEHEVATLWGSLSIG
jgi:hypothetical protein